MATETGMDPDEQHGADRPRDVSLANWRGSPANRWAFRNIPALLPVARIAAAPGAPLVEAPAAFDGFRLDLRGGASMDLDGFLEATATDGMIVLRDGCIVHESYRNGLDRDTPHILMSATKSVVGLLAGVLHGRGLLDVDAPVADYVPEVGLSGWQGVCVRHLLDMRSGVILDEAGQRDYQAAANWDPVPPELADANLHGFMETMGPAAAPHGGPFRYVSANTDLLGWVLERAAARPFADLASDLLWKPLGAQHDAFITLDRNGSPRCTGGLCTTLRDFARLGAMVVEGGQGIVPASWIDDILTAGDRQAWATGEWGKAFAFAGDEMSYRSSWYVTHDRPGAMFAMGIHGQNLFVDRQSGVVVAKFSSQNNPIDYQAIGLAHMALPRLIELALAA